MCAHAQVDVLGGGNLFEDRPNELKKKFNSFGRFPEFHPWFNKNTKEISTPQISLQFSPSENNSPYSETSHVLDERVGARCRARTALLTATTHASCTTTTAAATAPAVAGLWIRRHRRCETGKMSEKVRLENDTVRETSDRPPLTQPPVL